MAETRDPGKRQRQPSTPEEYPTPSPPTAYPSGDYTYILEIVMNMQVTMGKLVEAVDSIKSQIKDHGTKIETVRTDIHTAKTTLKVVGAILAAAIALTGWAVSKGVDAYVSTHPPAAATLTPAQK